MLLDPHLAGDVAEVCDRELKTFGELRGARVGEALARAGELLVGPQRQPQRRVAAIGLAAALRGYVDVAYASTGVLLTNED